MRHQQCKHRRQNVSSLPRPLALTATRDPFTSQKQACWQEHIRKETAAQVTWNISYGHKHLKEGPLPRKRLQKAPFRSVWEWGHPRPPATCWMARDQGAPGSAVQGSRCPGPSAQGRQSQAGPKSNSGASRPDQTRGLRHEAGPPAPCSCSSKASPSTAKARPPTSGIGIGRSRRRSFRPGSTAGMWVRATTLLPFQAFAGRPSLVPHHIPLAHCSLSRTPGLCTFWSFHLECSSCPIFCWLTFRCHLLWEVFQESSRRLVEPTFVLLQFLSLHSTITTP